MPEHEDVVAHDLRIVGCVIAVGHAFEFVLRRRAGSPSSADGNRNNSSPTRCGRSGNPSRCCRARVRRCSACSGDRRSEHVAPGLAVALQCFRVGRLRIVMRRERDRSCRSFAEFPSACRATWSIAGKASFPSQTKRGPNGVLLLFSKIDLAGIAGSDQRRALVDRAVAIDAGDRGRVARFAVEHAVAVDVDFEMAIAALHAVREMHVLQMHRFREFLRIVVRRSCCRRDRAGCLCDRV